MWGALSNEARTRQAVQEEHSRSIRKYEFEVGILEDKPYRKPLRGERGLKGKDVLSNYAGGPVRKASRKASDKMISEVSKENRERLGFNYLSKPFENRSSDIIKFTDAFFDYAFGRTEEARLRNLLQAIVRNPILKGEYGRNSRLTQKIKGFNRYMIDTAQLFKNIKADVKVKGDGRLFEQDLAGKLERIFGFDKVTFDQVSESREQEGVFIEIERARPTIKDGKQISYVQGRVRVFAQNDKLPYGYFLKFIRLADPEDTKDLFFFDMETNAGYFRNLTERSLSFVYFFSGQYDPSLGSITSIEISEA
jgi:hypothetical protein